MVKTMCNRGALLEKGHVVMIGQIDEVIEAYHTRAAKVAES
jgi:ABC-type polysaccharide/polyol phosphate transport system ATPase subunit